MAKIYAIYSINDKVIKETLHTWPECEAKVKGQKAVFKSFTNDTSVTKWFEELDKVNIPTKTVSCFLTLDLDEDIYLKFEKRLRKENLTAEEVLTSYIKQWSKTSLPEPQLFNNQKTKPDSDINEPELPWN